MKRLALFVFVVARPFEKSADAEPLVAGYNKAKMSGAVAVGRERNFLQWGFSAPPPTMTEAGRKFFLNCISYVAKFEGKAPVNAQ